MSETLTSRMQQRLLILARYLQALSHHDLETISQVLNEAAQDEVLERMLLEANAAYQEEQQVVVQPSELATAQAIVHNAALTVFSETEVINSETEIGAFMDTSYLPTRQRRSRFRRMSSFARNVAAILFVALLLGSFLALFASYHRGNALPGSNTGTAVTGKQGNLQVIPGPENGRLQGIAATSSSDAWAVGTNGIEHWDGHSWRLVLQQTGLLQVAATSANDVWATGTLPASGPTKTIHMLIMHWNGQLWSTVPDGNPSQPNMPYALAALSANDAWIAAVSIDVQGHPHLLTEHWNGQRWSIIQTPQPGTTGNELFGLTALSANNVWAVGYASYNQPGKEHTITLIEHWNGQQWTVVPSPNMTSLANILNSVAAVSANDIWAVGGYNSQFTAGTTTGDGTRAMIEHWNGQRWSIVSGPQSAKASMLNSVTASATNDVWAVGMYSPTDKSGDALIEHWNGQSWSPVSSPHPGAFQTINAVAHIPGTKAVWVVGSYTQQPSPQGVGPFAQDPPASGEKSLILLNS